MLHRPAHSTSVCRNILTNTGSCMALRIPQYQGQPLLTIIRPWFTEKLRRSQGALRWLFLHGKSLPDIFERSGLTVGAAGNPSPFDSGHVFKGGQAGRRLVPPSETSPTEDSAAFPEWSNFVCSYSGDKRDKKSGQKTTGD